MHRPDATWGSLLIGLLVVAGGCVPTQPFYLREDGDLSHYLEKATQAEHPDVEHPPLEDVAQSQRPLSLANPNFQGFWDLSLQECVAIALLNTKNIRGGQAARLQNGQIFAGTQEGSLVLNAVGRFVTTYDPAIVESNPGQQIGALSNFLNNGAGGAFNGPTTDGGVANVRQGVEAALSEFDAQLSITGDPSSGIANSVDRPQNVLSASPFFPTTLDLRGGGVDINLSKRTAEGTLFQITSSTDYIRGNQRGFPVTQPLLSTWTQVLQVEARHPLLRGRGSQINRMPIIIARIGTDMEILNVQANLQDMLNNIEIRYWDLYLAYRNLETAKVAQESALVTWRIVYDKFQQGVEPVQAEAQAQEQYFNFRASVESATRALFNAENELRLLMGLAATDGRVIRPKDEPTLARVEFDWTEILAEAIARRPELISKRWQVKQRELELILARNQLLPQLDVGAQYRWLGVGDDLITAGRRGVDFPAAGSTAWEELTGGKYQEFTFLFQYQMPIGFRRELAAVRHAQLRLAREKATLEDMELDVSHGLAHALRNLETNYQLAQTNGNRWAAAQREVEARTALYQGGRTALDDVLQAQQRRAVAQSAFWTAVVEYNKSIADLHTRKGSIMDYNGIAFAEGTWPQKAYWDALERARERDAGWYLDYGWTRPRVVSRGPVPTAAEVSPPAESGAADFPEGAVEELPAPEPTPATPPAGTSDRPTRPAPPPRPVPQETRRPQPATPARPLSSKAAAGQVIQTVAAEEEAEDVFPPSPPTAPDTRRLPASRAITAEDRPWEEAIVNPLRPASP